MKIRHRITLWITGAGILASLAFSLIVFVEMLELPNDLINAELESVVSALAVQGDALVSSEKTLQPDSLRLDISRYWIKVFDSNGRLLYQSDLARLVDLPLRLDERSYICEKNIPQEQIVLNQDADGEVVFKVRNIKIPLRGKEVTFLVAKPIEFLEEEIVELGKIFGLGLLCTILLLVFLSFNIAGRILKPVNVINRHAEEINSKTLNQRIPLGRSRDELYTLTGSLNHMFDRLQHSFARQKEFVANASHELKSPITLLLLFMEEAGQREDLPEPFKQKLTRQTDILHRMGRMVKNLLNLSALELKDFLEVEECVLPEMLDGILTEYQEVLAGQGITIEKHCPAGLRFMADHDTMHRALVNLIDNASRYNCENGRIVINARRQKKDNILLTIANTGQLISPDERLRVFDQFYRVEKSRSRELGGSGLGLAIVKRIIELHKGRIEIVAGPSDLTTFQITLPSSGA